MKLFAGLIVITSILLTSCATHNYKYQTENNPQQWQGKNIQALQQAWGLADQTFHTRSGTSYYVYTTSSGPNFYNSIATNFDSSTVGAASYNLPRTQYSGNLSLKCTTVFKTDATGVITNIMHEGSNCGGEWVPKH